MAEEKPKTKMEALREKFKVFDLNGDGVLTRDEIRMILTRPCGGARTMNMKMANDFLLMFSFDKIDKDGNGTIDLDEFVGALLPGVAKQVFEEFDKKGTGELSIDQLPSMLSHLSMKKGKKLDGVKADLQLGDKMVLNDFIRVAATMHARGLEPEPEKKKKEKEEKV